MPPVSTDVRPRESETSGPTSSLWSLRKSEYEVRAELCVLGDGREELRYLWCGKLLDHQVFARHEQLLEVARWKQSDLRARGWR